MKRTRKKSEIITERKIAYGYRYTDDDNMAGSIETTFQKLIKARGDAIAASMDMTNPNDRKEILSVAVSKIDAMKHFHAHF